MIRYLLTSPFYKGAVQFNYDNSGLLVFYSVLDAELSEKQLLALLKKIPREEQDLTNLILGTQFVLRKVDQDLSFENFWLQYDKKIHPHRCEPLWKKYSEAKRVLALKAIAPYTAYCTKTGVAKANPENFLKKDYYKTDWSKEV